MSRFVPPAKWRKVAKNAWKTDLGAGLPEVVIVEMSNSEYKKFRSSERAAKRYINNRKYLRKPTREVVFTKGASSLGTDGDLGWIVIIAHTPDSMVLIAASQM